MGRLRAGAYRLDDATLQPTLAGHRGSAARRRAGRSQGNALARAFGGKQGAVRPAVGRVRQCRDRPAPHRRADRLVRSSRTAGTNATRVYLEAAEACSSRPRRAAIEQAGLDARPRSTGWSPSRRPASPRPASKRASGRGSGLRDDVRRVPMFGLGCAGGVNGLATAARLAAAEPGSRWLFVTVETCSISIRLDSDDPAAIVATALFGDGAAAAVVTSGEHGLATITGAAREAVARHAADHGLGGRGPGPRRRLRPRHPAVHRGEAGRGGRRDAAPSWASAASDIDRFCCHPGGVKVIDAIETALELPQGDARPRARGAARLRQYERADGAVRARAADRARPSRDAC